MPRIRNSKFILTKTKKQTNIEMLLNNDICCNCALTLSRHKTHNNLSKALVLGGKLEYRV